MSKITHVKEKLLWLIPSFLVIALYFQTHTHTYISYDDANYTYENTKIFNGLTWDSIKWSLTESHFSNYHPVTWWSHMLDFMMFGDSPGMFALENGFIHALNTLLVTLLLAKIFKSKPEAIIGGLIFAVHPVLIEAIAWISQRKTLLSTFWALLSMILYLEFIDCNKTKHRLILYISSIFCFIISLLSKSMYVTLPALLLFIEISHEDRIGKMSQNLTISYIKNYLFPLLSRLLPFGILTILFAFIAIWSQSSGGAISDLNQMSIAERMENILLSYSIYIKQFFFPKGLSVFYEIRSHIDMFEYLFCGLILSTITASLYAFRNRFGIKPLIGWLFFLISLLPVIGIVQIGAQSHADRYMYGPIIGLIISIIAIGNYIKPYINSQAMKLTSKLSIALWIVLLCISTFFSIGNWKNNLMISIATLKNYSTNRVATHIFAIELMRQNNFENARDIFLKMKNDHPNAYLFYSNLALCEFFLGNSEKAIEYQKFFVERAPIPGTGLTNLAKFYCETGRYKEADKVVKTIRSYDYQLNDTETIVLKQVEEEVAQHANDE